MASVSKLYGNWVVDKTPQNMSAILKHMDPLIKAEASKYGGGPVINTKAKALAAKAVMSYNPNSGARITSWVVTNLQPLHRYRNDSQVIRMPEVASARAAELNRLSGNYSDEYGHEPTDEQLADYSGLPVKTVQSLRDRRKAVMSESSMGTPDTGGDESSGGLPPVDRESSSLTDAADEVFKELDDRDKFIYEHSTGVTNKEVKSKKDIADILGVSPAFVSQRSEDIANRIIDVESLFR